MVSQPQWAIGPERPHKGGWNMIIRGWSTESLVLVDGVPFNGDAEDAMGLGKPISYPRRIWAECDWDALASWLALNGVKPEVITQFVKVERECRMGANLMRMLYE